MIDPFEKKIPSVFVICSPLQLLCTVAAMRQLEIDNCKLIAYLPKSDKRNDQVLSLLNIYNLKYTTISNKNKFSIQVIKLLAIKSRNKGYPRLFVGDIKNAFELYVGYRYIMDGAEVVSLDDGNGTIEVLKDKILNPLTAWNKKLLDFISKRRRLHPCKNLLTIYSDICNPRYNIKALLLNKVINFANDNNREKKNVFIVGTNVENYCSALGISESVYINKLDCLMKMLKNEYPNEIVYFIPHGRENKEYGQILCKRNACIFLRPKTMIEMELLNFQSSPKAVLGYTSAALYTLKKIFPETRVVNILFDMSEGNSTYRSYLECSDYYVRNGIELYKDSLC